MLVTNELVTLLNAVPITTPIAKSITFPLRANFLNSAKNDFMTTV
jgi:hypothetical protein